MVRHRLMCMVWQDFALMWCLGGWSVSAAVVAGEEAGERVDGFEQQRVDLGLPAGGDLVPPGGCLLLVLGGLVPGLVAGPPPAQCLGAGHGGGGRAVSRG